MNVNADDGNQRHDAPETVEAFRAYTRLAVDTIVEVETNTRASAKAPKMACTTVPSGTLADSGVAVPQMVAQFSITPNPVPTTPPARIIRRRLHYSGFRRSAFRRQRP